VQDAAALAGGALDEGGGPVVEPAAAGPTRNPENPSPVARVPVRTPMRPGWSPAGSSGQDSDGPVASGRWW
jgi:hypothetical protein